jgi:acyl-CoA reductase-like NAD-dependent aldehyde dehydrogenase
VTGYIESGRRDGARLRTGGGRPQQLNRGQFVEPTGFERVEPASRIAREEIFGPVVAATAFENDAEALAIANGLGYGLCAGSTAATSAGTRTRAAARGRLGMDQRLDPSAACRRRLAGSRTAVSARERGLPGIRNNLQVKNVGIRL